MYNKIQRLSPKEKRRFAFRRLGFFYVDARRIQDLISSFRFSTAAAYSIHSLEIECLRSIMAFGICIFKGKEGNSVWNFK
jgi:hypothetical protein